MVQKGELDHFLQKDNSEGLKVLLRYIAQCSVITAWLDRIL